MISFKQFISKITNPQRVKWHDIELRMGSHSVPKKKPKPKKLKEEASNHLAQQHSALVDHYKFKNRNVLAIRDYTNESHDLNDHLREKRNAAPDKPFDKRVKAMDSVVREHTAPHDIRVHTGVSGATSKLLHTHNGSNEPLYTQHHAFTSTSLNHDMAKEFAEGHKTHAPDGTVHVHHHILSLTVPKGHHGAYVDHHSSTHHMWFGEQEHEFVLPRKTRFKIHPHPQSVQRDGHSDGYGNKQIHHYHTWHAEIVKDWKSK